MSSSDWDTYFANTDSTHCGINECILYESDCSTVMTSPISMGASTPWDVTALKNIAAGYTLSLCVSCTNGYDIV